MKKHRVVLSRKSIQIQDTPKAIMFWWMFFNFLGAPVWKWWFIASLIVVLLAVNMWYRASESVVHITGYDENGLKIVPDENNE